MKSFSPKKEKINDLILYAVFLVLNKKEKANFDNILKECFLLSSSAFCLATISEWPDARKIDRPLRDLKQKGLIDKDLNNYFFFTKKGEKKLEGIIKKFKQGKLEF